MPELPDVTVYVECLIPRIIGSMLERVRVANPFLLRSVDPPLGAAEGRRVVAVRRVGKRIAIGVAGENAAAAGAGDADLYLVIHLMIAGRLHWRARGAGAPAGRGGGGGRGGLAAFAFSTGTLTLTEAGTKRRASLHVVRGGAGLAALDPGGLEVLDADRAAFRAALVRESHTVKRALTDPHLFSGIGNAYSDEILHRARLSPVKQTARLTEAEVERLWSATRATLLDWTERLRGAAGDGFPEGVTAFRAGMAVHGRFGKACPACGAAVQRIVYADNETNYCARCQTGGRLLSDRSLARLLKVDWPRTIEEWEERRGEGAAAAEAGGGDVPVPRRAKSR